MSAEENSFNLINLNNDHKNISDDNVSMPYNLEAEQSLLGAILFDNTSLEKTMDLIKIIIFMNLYTKKFIKLALFFLIIINLLIQQL